MPGGTLAQLIAERRAMQGQFSDPEVLAYTQQVPLDPLEIGKK